jgi:hypothetical protein
MVGLTETTPHSDVAGFRLEIEEIGKRWIGAGFKNYSLGKLILNSMNMGARYKLYFNKDIMLAIKAIVTIEAVGYILDPNMNLAKVSLPMPLRGIDAVPLAKAEDLFNQLDALETEFGQVADELVANWDSLCEGLKDKLSPKQWTAAERLLSQGPQAIRQRFRIERSVIPVSGYTGNLLPGTTNQATLLRVEAAAKQFLADTVNAMTAGLQEELVNATESLAQTCESGTGQVRQSSLNRVKRAFEKLRDFSFLATPETLQKIAEAEKSVDAADIKDLNVDIKQSGQVASHLVTVLRKAVKDCAAGMHKPQKRYILQD